MTDEYRFASVDLTDDGIIVADLSKNPRVALLACCIADQQRAGFGSYLDLRLAACESCGADGFNTGWGFWQFTCGAEILTDGEVAVPCSAQAGVTRRAETSEAQARGAEGE